VDPLAGSYVVEKLTDEIESQAMAYIERIDQYGGAIQAIEEGFQQREIQEAAYQYQRAIEDKKLIIVGTNAFQMDAAPVEELLKVDPVLEEKQKNKVKALKEKRDNGAVRRARAGLKKAAEDTDNLLPHILQAVKCYTTLGEISDTLKEVFGKYREKIIL
jgi:methylmalonyl-CoA mutase N-terminal domain/subunit